eukprot:6940282-Pyramimonas_sp.AAC.2
MTSRSFSVGVMSPKVARRVSRMMSQRIGVGSVGTTMPNSWMNMGGGSAAVGSSVGLGGMMIGAGRNGSPGPGLGCPGPGVPGGAAGCARMASGIAYTQS